MINKEYKYFAFISYSSKDTVWGKRLQKKLEHYRMPSTLCSERGWKRNPMNPVFFAPTDIQPGGLSEELQARLVASRNLIVICSPNSAKSEWVGKEIEFFHQLGRTKNIHFFIVDGEPHSGDPNTECFNPVIEKLGLPEILGANIHEKNYKQPWLNRERAYVQLISKLLEVEFDAIWQRHKRITTKKIAAGLCLLASAITIMLIIYLHNRPCDIQFSLQEVSTPNNQLPSLQNGIFTAYIGENIYRDTILSANDKSVFKQIPASLIGKKTRVIFQHKDYLAIDTTIILDKTQSIRVQRNDSVYGNISLSLFDKNNNPIKGKEVIVEGQKFKTDDKGVLHCFIPLSKQRPQYLITIGSYTTTIAPTYNLTGQSKTVDISK